MASRRHREILLRKREVSAKAAAEAQSREAAQPKPPETDRFARWRADPVAFALEVLGVRLWPGQIEILLALVGHRKVAVRSGQKCGKSIVAAVAALWFVCCFPGAYVVLTAPSAHQIKNVLWKEIRRLYQHAKIAIGGRLNQTPHGGLRFDDGRAIIGVSTDKPERMAGLSGANLFYIIDESSSPTLEPLFGTIEGNISGGGRVLMLANPTRVTGFFYDSFHRNRPYWKTIQLSSEDASKYAAEIPGLMTPADIAEKLASAGRDSVWFQVRVLGNFPSQGENTIIRLDRLEGGIDRWLERFTMSRDGAEALQRDDEARCKLKIDDIELGPLEIGVDVARFGDDDSVITPRRGLVTGPTVTIHGYDSNEVAAAVCAVILQHRTPNERATVKVDGIGYGAAVVDRLRQDDAKKLCSVVDINVSEKADDEDAFPNLRSQLWFAVADWLADGGEVAPDAKLESELLAPTYSFDPRGRRVVQKKDDIKKTIGRSPDRADSLALAVYGRVKPLRKGDPDREKARRAHDANRFGDSRGF